MITDYQRAQLHFTKRKIDIRRWIELAIKLDEVYVTTEVTIPGHSDWVQDYSEELDISGIRGEALSREVFATRDALINTADPQLILTCVLARRLGIPFKLFVPVRCDNVHQFADLFLLLRERAAVVVGLQGAPMDRKALRAWKLFKQGRVPTSLWLRGSDGPEQILDKLQILATGFTPDYMINLLKASLTQKGNTPEALALLDSTDPIDRATCLRQADDLLHSKYDTLHACTAPACLYA